MKNNLKNILLLLISSFLFIFNISCNDKVQIDIVEPVIFETEDCEEGTKVSMKCATEGALIYYTTDESVPNEESDLYSDSLILNDKTLINAYAVKKGMEDSVISSIFVAVRTKIIENTITETKTIYVCPKDNKEFSTADEAANCCGVQTVEVEKIVYKYICPKDNKEFSTADEAADCCGVQIEYVDREVEKIIKKYVCASDSKEYDTLEEASACCTSFDYFTVEFNSNGGSSVNTQYVVEGKNVIEPKNPVRTGYSFSGWYINENIYDFSECVSTDLTLIAKWNPIIYKVTLLDSDQNTVLKELEVAYNEKIIIPSDINKEGYIFGDWYYSGNKYNLDTEVTSDITLVASWIKKYAVGNIILSDGTILPYTISSLTDEQKSNAMAIIFREKTSTASALAMGIQISKNTYKWTTLSKCNPGSGIAGTIGSGDMDGSDNWAYIKGSKANYPAFEYCVDYGTTYNYSSYKENWYLPTAAELYSLYLSKEIVNSSLKKIGKDKIKEATYWTSNNNYRTVSSFDSYWQKNNTYYYYEADSINFADGTENNVNNTYSKYVLSIRKVE